MSRFKFLHCADIHLDSPLKGIDSRIQGDEGTEYLETIRQATRHAFQNMVNLAIKEEVAFVVIAGDIFDGNLKDMKTGFRFIEHLSRLKRSGIHTYLVLGNHDAQCEFVRGLNFDNDAVTLFPANEAVSIPERRTGEVILHGQSFPTRDVRENLAQGYPKPDPQKFNIGVLHTNVGDTLGHGNYAPCSLNQLMNHGYQYWALGHVHEHKILSGRAGETSPHVVYPGNLQGRSVRETGLKGAVVVEVEDNIVQECRFVECATVRWHHIEYEVTDRITSIDELCSDIVATQINPIADHAKSHVVRISLNGETLLHGALRNLINVPRPGLSDLIYQKTVENQTNVFIEKVQVKTREVTSSINGSIEDHEVHEIFQDVTQEEIAEQLKAELRKFHDSIPAAIKMKVTEGQSDSEVDIGLRYLLTEDYVRLAELMTKDVKETLKMGGE